MRNDVNASNEDSRREIILNVRIKCLLQVTILELVKIEMNDILDVMFLTKKQTDNKQTDRQQTNRQTTNKQIDKQNIITLFHAVHFALH